MTDVGYALLDAFLITVILFEVVLIWKLVKLYRKWRRSTR